MGLLDLFKKKGVNSEDTDYMANAEGFEKQGDYAAAILEYEKVILIIYANKPESRYRHIIKKIIDCYKKLGDMDKVYEMWPNQYDPSDYDARQMYELIKVLESAGRTDLVLKVYDKAGKKLIGNKIDFLIKHKRIPEANALLSEVLMSTNENNPAIENLWLMKAKLSMSMLKFEEANRYLGKLIEKNPRNEEARKLKEFCIKQARA